MSSTLKVDILQDSGGNTILSSDGSGNVTQTRTGITMADQFRLSSSLGNPGNVTMTTNFERPDDATFNKIGTGMTESSGIFTFPETGLYLVSWTFVLLNLSDGAVSFYTSVSTDSGSSYDDVARGLTSNRNGTSAYNMGTTFAYVNVTNASTSFG